MYNELLLKKKHRITHYTIISKFLKNKFVPVMFFNSSKSETFFVKLLKLNILLQKYFFIRNNSFKEKVSFLSVYQLLNLFIIKFWLWKLYLNFESKQYLKKTLKNKIT